MVRLVVSSAGPRFCFGACGSIKEMLSTVAFGTGAASVAADSVGVVFGVGFFAVIGAKADFVIAGFAADSAVRA